eukprot:CAMPEP_0170175646 /NCGR_PEP_ID=MMETSP0040_2-20121228/8689_1 /TAXON_ID=641309 /ORGANISM="Lotharella oceanica, Strain CCMP622" /LENGTH=312 /DNA_ID=CAMNT_0010417699 /DNA_START=412 /DNA_END=1351 /DNA_ORIENTATION=-
MFGPPTRPGTTFVFVALFLAPRSSFSAPPGAPKPSPPTPPFLFFAFIAGGAGAPLEPPAGAAKILLKSNAPILIGRRFPPGGRDEEPISMDLGAPAVEVEVLRKAAAVRGPTSRRVLLTLERLILSPLRLDATGAEDDRDRLGGGGDELTTSTLERRAVAACMVSRWAVKGGLARTTVFLLPLLLPLAPSPYSKAMQVTAAFRSAEPSSSPVSLAAKIARRSGQETTRKYYAVLVHPFCSPMGSLRESCPVAGEVARAERDSMARNGASDVERQGPGLEACTRCQVFIGREGRGRGRWVGSFCGDATGLGDG